MPGNITIVGVGPGARDLMVPRAVAAVRAADAIVAYEGYIEGIADLCAGKQLCTRPLGEEIERARDAIELARAGKRVAVVSSGDAGIYGMASVLFEVLGEERSIEVEVVPGVTAGLAAAALLGAPLGHDFAVISLSDLLTPWTTIEQRIEAAARGDFVLVLYNPASRRRTWQLPRALEILRAYRSPQTPVGLVDGAFRPEQRTTITTLAALDPESATMTSTVVIGSSRTRQLGNRMVTPRGYRHDGALPSHPMSGNLVPTTAGERIFQESLSIVAQELQKFDFHGAEFEIVQRMVHATADFDFATNVRFDPRAISAARAALQEGVTIVTDVEMLRSGIRRDLLKRLGCRAVCLVDDPQSLERARSEGLTRSAAGIWVAADQEPAPIVAVGSAPTALDAALQLTASGNWSPRVILGIPVGFVGVEEAKKRLIEQSSVPFITAIGRKGGTSVTAAVVNALLELAIRERAQGAAS